jgi:hypothetical protein
MLISARCESSRLVQRETNTSQFFSVRDCNRAVIYSTEYPSRLLHFDFHDQSPPSINTSQPAISTATARQPRDNRPCTVNWVPKIISLARRERRRSTKVRAIDYRQQTPDKVSSSLRKRIRRIYLREYCDSPRAETVQLSTTGESGQKSSLGSS